MLASAARAHAARHTNPLAWNPEVRIGPKPHRELHKAGDPVLL
jgi:hypothetical protein